MEPATHLSKSLKPLSSIAGTILAGQTFTNSSLVLFSTAEEKHKSIRDVTRLLDSRFAMLTMTGSYGILLAVNNIITARLGCEKASKNNLSPGMLVISPFGIEMYL